VLHSRASGTWLDATFVIDYLEPSVRQLSAEYAKTLNGSPPVAPSRESIVAFVHGMMTPTYARGFDIASEVATRREGDCTEYAVITAALARAAGVPARVVMGLALLHGESQYLAYGHAWAELRVDGRWIVADAALAGLPTPVRYVPFGLLENEGMGFRMEMARLTPLWAQQVDVLGPGAKVAQ
jgi:hypothetical protein